MKERGPQDSEHQPQVAAFFPESITTTEKGVHVSGPMVASSQEAANAAGKIIADLTGSNVSIETTEGGKPTGKIVGFTRWGASWTPSADVRRAAALREQLPKGPKGNPKEN